MKNNCAQFKIHKLALLLLISILLFTGSCKKELLVNEKLNNALVQRNLKYKNGPQVSNLTFTQFKGRVNQSALGNLKKSFNIPDAPNRMMSLNAEEVYKGFTLLTDSIKMIIAGNHTSYVFAVKLATARAVSFQNLTIDESPEKTTAFITTYTPTKAWLKKWQDGTSGKFDGSILVTPLDLGDGNTATPLNLSSVLKNEKISSIGPINKTSNVAPGCTEYTFYYREPYQCGSGNHWPGDTNCTLTGNGAAGYANFTSTMTICNGGGGGGGTTPNPDPNYNPCNSTPPNISFSGLRGERLAVVPPPTTPCDLQPLPPAPIITIDPLARNCIRNISAIIESKAGDMYSCIGGIAGMSNVSSAAAIGNLYANSGYTINISESVIPDAFGTDAFGNPTTITTNGSTNSITGNITLNSTVLNEATDLGIAATMIHEMMHSYFLYGIKRSSGSERVFFEDMNSYLYDNNGILYSDDYQRRQHEQMAAAYVNSMASLLEMYAKTSGIYTSPDSSISLNEYCKDVFWRNLATSQSSIKAPNQNRAERNGLKELKNQSGSSNKKGC